MASTNYLLFRQEFEPSDAASSYYKDIAEGCLVTLLDPQYSLFTALIWRDRIVELKENSDFVVYAVRVEGPRGLIDATYHEGFDTAFDYVVDVITREIVLLEAYQRHLNGGK